MTRLPLLVSLALAAAALPPPAAAQQAVPCDWQASAWNLVEPWEAHSRQFANGAVRVALLDTIEPAAGAFHILVLSPPEGELGSRQCRTLGAGQGMGFAGIAFDRLEAGYDPATGLTFTVPVQVFDGATGGFFDTTLRFSLNQASGAIAAGYR